MELTVPGVSAIIPTIGRNELPRAIASIKGQDYPGTIEIIVVGDLTAGSLDEKVLDRVDLTLYTGGGRRAGAARNLGIAAATQPYVAFLDDDDQWEPWKLSKQMPAFEELQADVVGTQAVYRNLATCTTSAPVPAVPKSKDESVAEYLFRRRPPRVTRPAIFTPTLVARTESARQVPWDETLPRHQDWDWIDRMERDGARIVQIRDPSVVLWTGSTGSISSSADWESSLAWAETRRSVWDSAILADFLAGQTLRYAIQAKSIQGVVATIEAIARTRRIPSANTWMLGLGGVIPRSLLNRIMTT